MTDRPILETIHDDLAIDSIWNRLRGEFYIPQGKIYLDGNSLGLLSRRVEHTAESALNSWRERGIDGWSDGEVPWLDLTQRAAEMLASLVGTSPVCITLANSTTVNLHQMLSTLYRPDGKRRKIVIEQSAFPSDRYAVRSHLKMRGRDSEGDLIQIVPGKDRLYSFESIEESLTEECALLLLPSVVYTTGQLLDLRQIAAAARDKHVVAGFDCSHSVGAVPHTFDLDSVDFAFWCSYKYLNGGPGCTSGLYLNARHHQLEPGLAGWFGVSLARQFDMADYAEYADGAARLQVGTPNILSLAPLIGALQHFQEVGMEAVRHRSLSLTKALIAAAQTQLIELGFSIVTPGNEQERGGHISLAHAEALRISQAIKAAGVVGDFRFPDMIRLAPVAFYNTFEECATAVEIIAEVVRSRRYEEFSIERPLVS